MQWLCLFSANGAHRLPVDAPPGSAFLRTMRQWPGEVQVLVHCLGGTFGEPATRGGFGA